MNVMVIGAGGMLGLELTQQVRVHGWRVQQCAWPEANVNQMKLNITDARAVRDVVAATRPDIVFNCAAYTNVDQAEQEEPLATAINGDGVGYLAEACNQVDALLAHVSTDYVFDGQGVRPYCVDDPVAPQSAYGRSKLAGERILAETAKRWLIVRTAWLFGRGGKNFVETIAHFSKQRDSLRVVNDQTGCPTYVPDLARCLIDLAEQSAQGIFHFCNGPQCTWYDLARKIVEYVGADCAVHPCGSDEYPRPAQRPAYSVLDCRETLARLNWTPRTWDRAVEDYLEPAVQQS